MGKKKTVRIERLESGIVKLHDTCANKSHYYKIDLGGKWNPTEKCWMLADCKLADAELQSGCDAAPYNSNSKAAYWERMKKEKKEYVKNKEQYDALMKKWEAGEVPYDEKSEWAREHDGNASDYSRVGDFEKGVLIRRCGNRPFGREVCYGYVIGKKDAVLDTMHHAKTVHAHCVSFVNNSAFEAYPETVFDLPDGRAMSHFIVDFE